MRGVLDLIRLVRREIRLRRRNDSFLFRVHSRIAVAFRVHRDFPEFGF